MPRMKGPTNEKIVNGFTRDKTPAGRVYFFLIATPFLELHVGLVAQKIERCRRGNRLHLECLFQNTLGQVNR
jgi:hypothetical protein